MDQQRPRYPHRPPREVNPNGEVYGHYTGRCPRCQSNDLWDDNLWYGCNNCGGAWGPDETGGGVRIVPYGG